MTDKKDPLDEIALPAMTYRQLLEKCLVDSWDARKAVAEGADGQEFVCVLRLQQQVPMEMAKRVLWPIMEAEQQQRKNQAQ